MKVETADLVWWRRIGTCGGEKTEIVSGGKRTGLLRNGDDHTKKEHVKFCSSRRNVVVVHGTRIRNFKVGYEDRGSTGKAKNWCRPGQQRLRRSTWKGFHCLSNTWGGCVTSPSGRGAGCDIVKDVAGEMNFLLGLWGLFCLRKFWLAFQMGKKGITQGTIPGHWGEKGIP